MKFSWKRREGERERSRVDGQKHACRAITAVHLGSRRADISVGCVNAAFRGCVGEEKGYGHVGEVANGAQSTCLPSLACFAGRVYRHTVWACVCTRVCVHTSCNCARAYVHTHSRRKHRARTPPSWVLTSLPRHCRTDIAPISDASIQLPRSFHSSPLRSPIFPLPSLFLSFSSSFYSSSRRMIRAQVESTKGKDQFFTHRKVLLRVSHVTDLHGSRVSNLRTPTLDRESEGKRRKETFNLEFERRPIRSVDRGGKQTRRGSVTRVIIRAISFVRVDRRARRGPVSSQRVVIDNYARADPEPLISSPSNPPQKLHSRPIPRG